MGTIIRRMTLKSYWKKKIITVIVPYYCICLIGYLFWNYPNITENGIFRILFFQSQWYINYILINYIIFYSVTYITTNYRNRIKLFLAIFTIWFVIDTLFFASNTAPFLRARQMYAFLSGIVISHNKEHSVKIINTTLFIGLNLIIGITWMGITNLPAIKSQALIVSNTLSLLTVVPLAYAIIGITMRWKILFTNSFLSFCGLISYEIFLVHSNCLWFSQRQPWMMNIFLGIVFGGSYLFHIGYCKVKERIN